MEIRYSTEGRNKRKYRELCRNEHSIPIFSRDWWLDAAAGENNWDVIICEDKDKNVVASLPYLIKKKYFLCSLSMPALTKYLGIWFKYPENQKYANRLSYEKKLAYEIIAKLPKYHKFYQNFHFDIENWLPFFWKGFEQRTYYTYILQNINAEAKIWNKLQTNIRTDIKKAINKYKIRIREGLAIEDFIHLNELIFEKKGAKVPYPNDLIRKIDSVCLQKNARKIFYGIDDENRIHSAIYIVYDENTAYYIMGGRNPNYTNSGANTLALWEAIKKISEVVGTFDFEGSMIENIEHYFRSFGSIQKPYFNIYKYNSKSLKLFDVLRENI